MAWGPFSLMFNPFHSMHGGQTDSQGNFTEAGKHDFFSPLWSSRTTDEWKRFLHGDYRWDDYLLNPGSVIANPAGQLADPGNFFSGDWYRNDLRKGKIGDRTAMSALIAGLIYGGSSAGSLFSGAGEGASGTGGGASGAGGSSGIFDAGGLLEGTGNTWEIGSGPSFNAAEAGAGGGFFSNLLNSLKGFGNQLTDNPQKTAVWSDQIGQGFDPNNSFAGVGTKWGQSSIANDQAQGQQKERKALTDMLARALGFDGSNPTELFPRKHLGDLPDQTAPGGLTPIDQIGPTSVTYKAAPNGTVTATHQSTVSKPVQQKGLSLQDLVSF